MTSIRSPSRRIALYRWPDTDHLWRLSPSLGTSLRCRCGRSPREYSPPSLAADEYAFYTVEPNGHRTPVEFREFDDGLALLWGPSRFDRTPSGG